MKISLRYDSSENLTWIRINKKSISEEDLKIIYSSKFHLWKINKINYVFTVRGDIIHVENELKQMGFNV